MQLARLACFERKASWLHVEKDIALASSPDILTKPLESPHTIVKTSFIIFG